MKNLITNSILVIILIGVAGLYYLHFKQSPVVYVSSAVLLNEYEAMIVARGQYEKKAMSWKANIDTLTAEVQNAIRAYEKESRTMTAKEKELSRELIKAKQDKLVNYQRAIKEKSQQEDYEATQAVIAEVNAFLKEYGKKHGYKIILAATDMGNIAYAEEDLDITQEVVDGLNKEYSGE